MAKQRKITKKDALLIQKEIDSVDKFFHVIDYVECVQGELELCNCDKFIMVTGKDANILFEKVSRDVAGYDTMFRDTLSISKSRLGRNINAGIYSNFANELRLKSGPLVDLIESNKIGEEEFVIINNPSYLIKTRGMRRGGATQLYKAKYTVKAK